jgi:hypothetical protein
MICNYCQKEGAEVIARWLTSCGIQTAVLHVQCGQKWQSEIAPRILSTLIIEPIRDEHQI